jgi:hypothetical protein
MAMTNAYLYYQTAVKYQQQQFCSIAINDQKKSIFTWKKYQQRFPTKRELYYMFNHQDCAGMAIVCGQISAGLEVIDIDLKYDLSGRLFHDLQLKITEKNGDLMAKLVIARTRNNGRHLLYRCACPGKNTALARRAATEDELKANPNVTVKVLIETRAEQGYCMVAPTPGYEFIQHGLSQIALITEKERQIIFTAARQLNLLKEPERSINQRRTYTPQEIADSPFTDFNNRGDIKELLVRHGWTVEDDRSDKIVFKRPGDTDKASSGDFNYELGMFSTFSTSTDFRSLQGYRPSAVFAILECGGDFKTAARKLLAMGFGTSRYKTPNGYRQLKENIHKKGI